ncbi:hypothetical protein ACLOJK_032932 [Asimina triloba]
MNFVDEVLSSEADAAAIVLFQISMISDKPKLLWKRATTRFFIGKELCKRINSAWISRIPNQPDSSAESLDGRRSSSIPYPHHHAIPVTEDISHSLQPLYP